MDDIEAQKIIETEIAPALKLFTSRRSATLHDLNLALVELDAHTQRLPRDINWPDDFEPASKYLDLRRKIESEWPELGFYDDTDGSEFSGTIPESIGDAIDDLCDIALDLAKALEISGSDAVGCLSQLRFWYDTHWREHLEDLQKYLSHKANLTN